MNGSVLDPEVAFAFQCKGTNHLLGGGEGRSIKVGDCVLKPINNEARYSWACDLLLRLMREGFRISEPKRAINGSFVFNGWGASSYEPGEHILGRWHEKLQVTRSFHTMLNQLDHSPMPPSNDNWSQAHEIAWQQEPIPSAFDLQISDVIESFFTNYQPLQRSNGIIHSDICGNILFHESLSPCIIDFSPAYGSKEYAEAIMVADATTWEGAPVEIVQMLPYSEHYRQLLLRAINFRLIVAALFEPRNVDEFEKECREFESIIKVVSQQVD